MKVVMPRALCRGSTRDLYRDPHSDSEHCNTNRLISPNTIYVQVSINKRLTVNCSMVHLKGSEDYCSGPAPGVHGDEVAGGDGVQLPGRDGADADAGHGHRLEQEVEQP